jgi:hypothetical protein
VPFLSLTGYSSVVKENAYVLNKRDLQKLFLEVMPSSMGTHNKKRHQKIIQRHNLVCKNEEYI